MQDEEIIALCFEKNEKAIDEISAKYGAYCRKVAENVLRNPEDAEECFNSALLAFWNCVPPEKPEIMHDYGGMENLNDIPSPFLNRQIDLAGTSKMQIFLGRGCPNNCFYCPIGESRIRYHRRKS